MTRSTGEEPREVHGRLRDSIAVPAAPADSCCADLARSSVSVHSRNGMETVLSYLRFVFPAAPLAAHHAGVRERLDWDGPLRSVYCLMTITAVDPSLTASSTWAAPASKRVNCPGRRDSPSESACQVGREAPSEPALFFFRIFFVSPLLF